MQREDLHARLPGETELSGARHEAVVNLRPERFGRLSDIGDTQAIAVVRSHVQHAALGWRALQFTIRLASSYCSRETPVQVMTIMIATANPPSSVPAQPRRPDSRAARGLSGRRSTLGAPAYIALFGTRVPLIRGKRFNPRRADLRPAGAR